MINKNIPHSTINSLLHTLRNIAQLSFLPKDARTLTQTPKQVTTMEFYEGHYFHFGIENGIRQQMREMDVVPDTIILDVNIDGLPISKSSSNQFWPILAKIRDTSICLPPFIIGIFHGYRKPTSTEYLTIFVNEMLSIRESKLIRR